LASLLIGLNENSAIEQRERVDEQQAEETTSMMNGTMNGTKQPTAYYPKTAPPVAIITAVEEDQELEEQQEDVIPGPLPGEKRKNQNDRDRASTSGSSKRANFLTRMLNSSQGGKQTTSPTGKNDSAVVGDSLQISTTEHKWAGAGILASLKDLNLPQEEFAAGCNLLQAAASGNLPAVTHFLSSGKTHANFRDYDRRTALHVAASEGQLATCQYLVQQGAQINRSDRWGGSPLDDAHRHRHVDVIQFLRQEGATTGSGNRINNLITAAAEGDVDEVRMFVQQLNLDGNRIIDVNKGDYDKRTALHLAAGEGRAEILRVLCEAGADVNVEDRWNRRPLDDAHDGGHEECMRILEESGALRGKGAPKDNSRSLDQSGKRLVDNLKVDFSEIEMVDRIGSGAFGEIYKCRWRGTLVAAKIIKSAKIRQDWVNKRMMQAIKEGKDVDDAVKEMDDAEIDQSEKDLALADFRQEISVLKSLRHPHIVLLLAYSTTANYECLISELMKCSLLDIFKSHIVQGTKMHARTQMAYATQLALGMNYLHQCKPPIIHRDLKPANLLIDHTGILKIADFGLAKSRPDPTKKETEKFVMTGETGSYRFMAPECYRHEEYNETVDVYSFAMILFYLLVGRPPWPHLSGVAAVKKAADEGDRPNIPRDLDSRMVHLLKDCWDENPSMRPAFNTIVEILSAYNRDVFKIDSTVSVVTASLASDQGCQCVIM
jgi:serine/threonine protein kinase/ankyrin repeat protein